MDQEVSKIESYSRAFAEKVCNSFFSSSEAINGEQILSLTPVDQVNLFVIKNLFKPWKDEIQKLKSPYFDYNNQEVGEALSTFMNTVSRHILIKKEFFRPLLEKSVFDSFLLTIKPSVFIRQEFEGKGSISAEELNEVKKYFRIHKPFWEAVITRVQKEISSEEIIRAFDNYLIHSTSEEQRNYLDKFYMVLPFEIAPEAKTEPEISRAESQTSRENKKVENMPVVNEPTIKQEPKGEKIQQAPDKRETKEENILNEKFAATQLTLNDVLKQTQSKTIADKISESKIENIRSAISLNQKFRFMKTLFKGELDDYENALNDIDRSANYEEALSVINKYYASRYRWDFDNPEVQEFVQIVERKFYN